MIKEEIIRIRELMNLSEAAPGVGDDLSKKFAQILAPIFKRLVSDYTDEELEVLLKKGAKNIDEVKQIIKLIRETPTQQLLNKIPAADLLKLVDATDMSKFADRATDSVKFEQFFENNTEGWMDLSEEELKTQFEKLQKDWYDLIVNKGMGRFPEGIPPQAKEFYDKYYENTLRRFKRWMEAKRAGFNTVVRDVTDWQSYINSRTWDNIVPLTQDELKVLGKNNKGFFSSWKNLQMLIKDTFNSKLENSKELMSLMKTFGEKGTINIESQAQRISDLMTTMGQKDKEFYRLIERWIDENVVGPDTLKIRTELKSLGGLDKAKKLADGTTAKEIDEAYKDLISRRSDLLEQRWDIFTKWGKSWKNKYDPEMGKLRTILKKPEFKEFRNSLKLGTTLSFNDYIRIGRELGIPVAFWRFGKEVVFAYLVFNIYKSVIETLWEALTFYAFQNWETFQTDLIARQFTDDEGELELIRAKNDELSEEWRALGRTLGQNYLEALTEIEDLPGIIFNEVAVYPAKLFGYLTGTGKKFNDEELNDLLNKIQQGKKRIEDAKPKLQQPEQETQTTTYAKDIESFKNFLTAKNIDSSDAYYDIKFDIFYDGRGGEYEFSEGSFF
jgi:uncharacterized protein YjgD (DUF1641 family)